MVIVVNVYNCYIQYNRFEKLLLQASSVYCSLMVVRAETGQWYVDDTYIVMKKVHAQEFTDFQNTRDDDVKWITESEVIQAVTDDDSLESNVEQSLAFLETLSVVNADGSFRS